MCRSSLARRIDRRRSNDPQRGVGQDQTPLGIATTSRLGTSRMLVLPEDGAQTHSDVALVECTDEQRDERPVVGFAAAAKRHAVT